MHTMKLYSKVIYFYFNETGLVHDGCVDNDISAWDLAISQRQAG